MATANQALGPASLGVDLTDQSETPLFDLGAKATGEDGTEFVYVQATEALTLSDALAISNGFQASRLTKTLVDRGYLLGCVPTMQAAITAITSAYYFWACVKGVQNINCITGSSASVSPVYTSASAGTVGTASGSQTLIRGMYLVAANSSGVTASRAGVLNNPQSGLF